MFKARYLDKLTLKSLQSGINCQSSKFLTRVNCFPLKRIRPWLSKALLKSIKRKNMMYMRYLKRPSYANGHLTKDIETN